MVDDDRQQDTVRSVMQFVVRFFGGGADEPTPEKPVRAHTEKSGRTEVSVKKVLDFEHEKRVKALAEQSMKIRGEMKGLLEKVKAKIEADKKKTDG